MAAAIYNGLDTELSDDDQGVEIKAEDHTDEPAVKAEVKAESDAKPKRRKGKKSATDGNVAEELDW